MPKSSGMRGGRSRNENGRLRAKRSDVHVGTVEETYGIDLGTRSDAHIGTVVKREGVQSLDKLVSKNK